MPRTRRSVGRSSKIVSGGVADAAKPAVAFAGGVVTLGALISLLVPNIPAEHEAVPGADGGAWEPDPPDPDEKSEIEPSPA